MYFYVGIGTNPVQYYKNIPGKNEIWSYVIIRLTFLDILFIHTIQKTFPTESIFVCKLCCKRHYLMMVKLKHLDTNILNTRLISRNGQCAMIYRKWRKLPWESYQQSCIQDVSLNIYSAYVQITSWWYLKYNVTSNLFLFDRDIIWLL